MHYSFKARLVLKHEYIMNFNRNMVLQTSSCVKKTNSCCLKFDGLKRFD